MTDDGGFRVITAKTTETVREAVRAQKARGETARAFGELMTGAILYRETMAPQLRVQAILKGARGGQLVADSSPGGGSRGLVQLPKDESTVALRGGGALLSMMRSLPRGEPHRGVVEVPRDGSISTALMAYLLESEQVVSMISVGCLLDGERVVASGGYIIQLLPELSEAMLAIMTARLEDFPPVDRLFDGVAATPQSLLEELLHGIDYTLLDDSPLRFECTCSQVRVVTSLATLSPKDIEELMSDGVDIELTCDYCGAEYRVSPESLRGMLEPA
jgi:molecular chaperone Hsp33